MVIVPLVLRWQHVPLGRLDARLPPSFALLKAIVLGMLLLIMTYVVREGDTRGGLPVRRSGLRRPLVGSQNFLALVPPESNKQRSAKGDRGGSRCWGGIWLSGAPWRCGRWLVGLLTKHEEKLGIRFVGFGARDNDELLEVVQQEQIKQVHAFEMSSKLPDMLHLLLEPSQWTFTSFLI